jgi:branched-chain amino acid transport system permease protein
LLQALVSGVLTGGVYALVAVGLTLLFGVMRIVNFAHGDFLMLSMYGAFFSWLGFKASPFVTILWMVPAMAVVAALFYGAITRFLIGKSELSAMAVTMGVALLLQNVALLVFKADNFVVASNAASSLMLGGIALQKDQLAAAGGSAALITLLHLMLHKTDLGVMMRAVAQSTEGAALSGINFRKVSLWATIIGISTLGVAGPLLTPILYVNPGVGAQFTLTAFVVVIAGGLGNFGGAVAAGVLVGIAERVSSVWLPASLAAAVPFMLLVGVMLWRPHGLLEKGRG